MGQAIAEPNHVFGTKIEVRTPSLNQQQQSLKRNVGHFSTIRCTSFYLILTKQTKILEEIIWRFNDVLSSMATDRSINIIIVTALHFLLLRDSIRRIISLTISTSHLKQNMMTCTSSLVSAKQEQILIVLLLQYKIRKTSLV